MYSFPYSSPCEYCMMRQMGAVSSYIRLLNASPGTEGVDVFANGKPLVRDVRYKEFTPYVKVVPGTYRITAYPAGTTAKLLADMQITFRPNSIHTAAFIGRPPNTELFTIPEPRVTVPPGRANVRFVHLSPNSPAVDITTPDGKVIFPNVQYKGITNYMALAPGRHTLQARISGTDKVVLNVPNILLKPRRNYSVYAVGLSSAKPELQVLIPLDGNTYL